MRYLLGVTLVLLLGAALRVGMLALDVRFHPDEALYAGYARRMSRYGDILLADAPLDKPPLGLSLTAASFSVFGVGEWAARLPTVLISTLTLAVVIALSRQLYAGRVALVAGLLLALSPFDLAFSATAFHDPPLTLFLLLTCLCAVRDRWGLAGVWAACALATKQSAVQFLPLVLGIAACWTISQRWRWHDYRCRLAAFGIPVATCAALLAWWSAARGAPVDFWTLGVTNPGLLRFIRAEEIGPRLGRWLELLSYATGFMPLLIAAALPALAALRGAHRRREAVDVAISAGVLATLLGYWLLAFNTYDRYLHPLIPLILILAARGVVLAGDALGRHVAVIPTVAGLAALSMMPFTHAALHGALPIGGDRGEHGGIVALATAINGLPDGAVVYDHWLGWALGYYLGAETAIRLIFEPTPESFADRVCADSGHSYLAAPETAAARWLAVARGRGAVIRLIFQADRLALYRLTCAF